MSKDRSALRKCVLGLAWWLCPLLACAQEPIPSPRPTPAGSAPVGQAPAPVPPPVAIPPGQLLAPRPVLPAPVPRAPGPTPAPLNPTLMDGGLPAKPSPKVDPQELQRLLNRLKNERDALSAERTAASEVLGDDDSNAEQIAQLRLRLGEYLSRLGVRRFPEKIRAGAPAGPLPSAPRPAAPPGGTGTSEKAPAVPSRPPVDAVALGRTLFRGRDFAGALKAFRQVNLTGLKPEERRPIEYLIATCLKHLGKLDEAAAIYREVANSKGDEILADCAQWQLSALRWQQDLARQIQDLRQHLQTLENQP